MYTTFVALATKAGIACASDTEHTIYQLSETQILAVAINRLSPIPWDSIIKEYVKMGEPPAMRNLEDYAMDFMEYLSHIPCKDSWKNLTTKENSIIIMGYGSEDQYPSVYNVSLCCDEENDCLTVDLWNDTRIPIYYQAHIDMLGTLENVSPIIWGTSRKTRNYLVDQHVAMFEIYKQRVLEKFKETELESYVSDKIESYEPEDDFGSFMDSVSGLLFDEEEDILASLGIEEMAVAVEAMVNAELHIKHLRTGGQEPLRSTKELTVITRAEGLTKLIPGLYSSENLCPYELKDAFESLFRGIRADLFDCFCRTQKDLFHSRFCDFYVEYFESEVKIDVDKFHSMLDEVKCDDLKQCFSEVSHEYIEENLAEGKRAWEKYDHSDKASFEKSIIDLISQSFLRPILQTDCH